MLKKTITYTDYNGVERTEDHHFDLTEAEIAEMEWGVTGGLSAQLTRAVNAKDLPELVKIFKMMILVSYGIRNPDGIHFDKSEEISKAFSHTLAYSKLFMELATDDVKAAEFVNGIVPASKQTKPTLV
jgi:hypothetical protein